MVSQAAKNIIIPRDIIEEAYRRGEGEHHVGKYHVRTDKKITVISLKNIPSKGGKMAIVAFPKKEHLEDFEKAGLGVRADGPADYNPGAIGTMMVHIDPDPKEAIKFIFLQSHYVSQGPSKGGERREEGISKEHTLSRSLASKYAGWRGRAIARAYELAGQEGRDFEVAANQLLFSRGLIRHLSPPADEMALEMGEGRDASVLRIKTSKLRKKRSAGKTPRKK